jgi:F-type H+-transporting ATPase subunit epsilon
MPQLECTIVTPERTVRETTADFVALTLFDGELGIAPGHTPMIGRLGFGEMRIVEGGRTERYYIEGGFVEVYGNAVSVLTPRAIPAAELDAAVAEEQIRAAQKRRATTPEGADARDRVLSQGRAQLRVARRAK